jgi:hypothetical protein
MTGGCGFQQNERGVLAQGTHRRANQPAKGRPSGADAPDGDRPCPKAYKKPLNTSIDIVRKPALPVPALTLNCTVIVKLDPAGTFFFTHCMV